ncbi:hypothetical protein [Dactylosporangium sp. NPDC005555]|uniref:hypothetical protein n=1 Tax=Dactylosporangium sp. NPDC005555 TaxID=3154889 RepID=UPI0033AFCC6D
MLVNDHASFAALNRGRQHEPGHFADSSDFDVFVRSCYDDAVELLCMTGAEPDDAADAVGNALASIYTAGLVDASLPFLDALSLTFLLRARLQGAALRGRLRPAAGGSRSPYDTADGLRALLDELYADERALVEAVYERLADHHIVALFEAPTVEVCNRLARWWTRSSVPGRAGEGVGGNDVG